MEKMLELIKLLKICFYQRQRGFLSLEYNKICRSTVTYMALLLKKI